MSAPAWPPEGGRYEAIALAGLPEVRAGDDLGALIVTALAATGLALAAGDVLVIAQKIVSKAEGRRVRLADVRPSPRAEALAVQVRKDPRLVELILSESVRVVRAVPDVLIVEHRLGFVHANAGIDQSNVAGDDGDGDGGPGHGAGHGGDRGDDGAVALLLPLDPDASAARLRETLGARTGVAPGIVINDSFGRPWRRGTVGVAIGAAGLPAWADLRGLPDRHGRRLQSSELGHADEIAAAGSLLMGQAAEGRPVVLLRGLVPPDRPAVPVRAMLRTPGEDLFR